MNKKLEAAAINHAESNNLPLKSQWDKSNRYDTLMRYEVRDYVEDAFIAGAEFALKEAIEICNNNLGKYPVDIFRPLRSNEENVSIDRISAQMARHILILIRKELEQLLSKE